MSLYADYLLERTDDHIIESDTGFVTYRYLNGGKSVYIIDIFTAKDARRDGCATVLADYVVAEAKKHGSIELLGTVIPSTKGSTTSLRVLLNYGMRLKSSAENLIIFSKEI